MHMAAVNLAGIKILVVILKSTAVARLVLLKQSLASLIRFFSQMMLAKLQVWMLPSGLIIKQLETSRPVPYNCPKNYFIQEIFQILISLVKMFSKYCQFKINKCLGVRY